MEEQAEVGAPGDAWAQGPLARLSKVAEQDLPAALYVVATPLGNAADVSVRALWVLRASQAIACEDTRTSGAFLLRFGIRAPRLALHRHNEAGAAAPILERIARGERVALVSDAGTPAISDPGARLVRAALDAGLRVVPVPGPSSLTAALSVAGIASTRIRFLGFAPTAARARETFWTEVAGGADAAVVFEAPHRIASAAQEIALRVQAGRRIVLARELTKQFEEVVQASAATLAQAIESSPARGEYVLVFDAWEAQDAAPEDGAAIDATTLRWLAALREELPPARLAAVAARASGIARETLYRAVRGA